MKIPDYEYTNKTVTGPELEVLGNYITNKGVKKILEFGSGISTHFMGTLAKVLSLEDDLYWLSETDKLEAKYGPSDYVVIPWSGRATVPSEVWDDEPWDMIFIDGPVDTAMNTYGRRGAFDLAGRFIAAEMAKAVWMHDAWEHHCLDMAVRYLAPYCLQKSYPEFKNPNPHFLGASMILWEPPGEME